MKSLYSETRARVRAYGDLSPEFTTRSGVRQGFPISPFLFNFVMDILLETASTSDCSGVELLQGRELTDLEYADDAVLLGEDINSLQRLLDNLDECARLFGMRFAPSKCKMLLQDWSNPRPNLTILGEVIEIVDIFLLI